jgi:hypothetical protein
MEKNLNILFIIFSILYLIQSAAPPKLKPIPKIQVVIPTIVNPKNLVQKAIKRLDSEQESELVIEQSTFNTTYHKDYEIIEQQLILKAKNLKESQYYSKWSYITSSEGISLDDINDLCKVMTADGSESKTKCTSTHNIENNRLRFSYETKVYNGESLIIIHKYKRKETTKEILFKNKPITIPLLDGTNYCDYKFTIPKGYINLGLEKNLLKKKSDNVYYYKGDCPKNQIIDYLRFSPEKATWDSKTQITLENPRKFTNDITFTFPRYYRGGKIKNDNYKISSLESQEFDENKVKYENTKFQVTVPGQGRNKVGVEIDTSFTNKITDDFKVDIPSDSYAIDESKIPQEIKDKAKEIISEKSDYPDYYKIGSFVNSYMTYDLDYSGKDLTLDEIYKQKRGVCEHYTLLYNAMLNSVGIKTMYISGWAFDKNITFADEKSIGHAWSAALINGKWKELDSTWGLFEGVPAGHIMKALNNDSYSYTCRDSTNDLIFANIPSIKMTSVSEESGGDEGGDDDDGDDDNISPIRAKSNYLSPTFFLLILFYYFTF